MIGSRPYPSPGQFHSGEHLLSDAAEGRRIWLRNEVHFQLGVRRLIADQFVSDVARCVATSRRQIERSRKLLSREVSTGRQRFS